MSLVGLVFAAGLVLPIWWLTTTSPSGVPGLGAYPSAFIGDTVLLPTGCLMLVIGIQRLRSAPWERALATIGAGVAATVAVIVQAVWLSDPKARPNWTLPRPGHFDGAGWWHAFYFTVMSIVLVSLTVLFLARVRHGRSTADTVVKQISSGTGAAVLLTVLGSYTALVIHDNFAGRLNRASTSSLVLVGVAIALVAVLTTLAYGPLIAVLARPALVALGGVAAILSIVTTPLSSRMFLGMPAAAVGCMIAVLIVENHLVLTSRRNALYLSTWEIFGASVIAGIGVAAWMLLSTPLSQHDPVRISVIAVTAILLLLATFSGILGRRATAVFPITFAGILVVAVAAAAIWYYAIPALAIQRSPGAAAIVGLISAGVGIVVGLSTFAIKARTDGILGVPANMAKPGSRLAADRVPAAGIALALIALFAVGGFLATLAFVLATNRNLPFPAQGPWVGHELELLAIGAFAVLVAAVVFVVNAWSDVSGVRYIATVVAQITVPAVVSAFLIIVMVGQQVRALLIVEATAAGILVFLWTWNSVTNNVWLMQGRGMGPVEVASSLSLAVLAGSTTAWVLTEGVEAGGHVRSPGRAVVAAVIALVMAGVLVVLIGAARSVRLRHYTELPPWRGLTQDALCCWAIVLILIFPVIYLGTVTTFWSGVAAALPIVGLFAFPFYWIMKANREHPGVEARRLIKPRSRANALLAENQSRSLRRFLTDQRALTRAFRNPCGEESEEFIRVLSAHTRNQNRIATVMILIPIAGALQLLIGLAADNTWLTQMATRVSWHSIDG